VDDAVMLLVTTATMTRGDAAMMVATTGLGLRFGQRRVRRALVQVRRGHPNGATASRRGRLECFQCHCRSTPRSGLGHHVDGLPFGQAHVSLALALTR